MLKSILVGCLGATLWAQAPAVDGTAANLATLRYIDVATGTGAPYAAGKHLTVHYTGWLTNGKKFDSSVDRNQPFDFVQGRRQVIAGWDVGFEGMKVGGKRRLLIPYQFAYGETGSGSTIPPKAELIFDVELLDVADATSLPAAVDILIPLRGLATRLTSLAQAIPADKYSWSPATGSRTVAEVIAHANAVLQTFIDGGESKKVEALTEIAVQSKEAGLAMLVVKFATVTKDAEAARTGSLAGDAELLGQPTSRRGLLTALDVALGVDTGRLASYAEAMGIVLPWKPGPLD